MNSHTLNVLRALAMLGTVEGLAACRNNSSVTSTTTTTPPEQSHGNDQDQSAPPITTQLVSDVPTAGPVCPSSPPANQSVCAEFSAGFECEWYGSVRCTCRASDPTHPAQFWACDVRRVMGPLPPPELSA